LTNLYCSLFGEIVSKNVADMKSMRCKKRT